jgi:hypothetical protein
MMVRWKMYIMVCAALFFIIRLIDGKSSCIAGHIKLGLGTRLRAKPALAIYNMVPSELTTLYYILYMYAYRLIFMKS